ncbi:hypothetical protein NHH03_20360 [Stieleria sp. TO1_6]|uniref:hypothetical protein n=1 Tax=Stieleria tagensis TaxID=2956795 RepID=UPI00209B4DFE|nr:hypothetical protein [Stieleria tagensis]MCO8124109.1 hypothetical protein [Stieleria tagensis]
MSRKHILAALTWVMLCGQVALAQSDSSTESTESTEQDANPSSVLSEVQEEFREFVCSRAADFSDPNQISLIRLVTQRKFVDERFNQPVRQVIETAAKPDQWDIDRISRALELLPATTLKPADQVEILFRCYLRCSGKQDARLARELSHHLGRFPNQTSELVKQRMSEGDFQPKLLALLSIVGESSEDMLPLLMQFAKSQPAETATQALFEIDRLIRRVSDYKRRNGTMEEKRRLAAEDRDDKLIHYAERIFQRYDGNRDGKLDESEYSAMLMSPVAADANRDGIITVTEYAAWMATRQR